MHSTFHPSWQRALAHAVVDFSTLCELLALDLKDISQPQQAQASFALRVPREFVARMEKRNPLDPLLLQILPQALEMQPAPGFTKDYLNEMQQNPAPGLLHKYPHRVLLTLTGGCAINCRFCFRRHFPYSDNIPGRDHNSAALNYIRENNSIEEVILSGGDPLTLKDDLLAEFATQLEKIPHVQRLRIHTRLPIVIPQRVTDELILWLKKTRFQKIIMLHCNHANEIDESVVIALKKLRKSDAVLMNQSVLLKNINDSVEALVALNKKLFEVGILPYYLHLLDKVEGTAHFDVSDEKARELMAEIKKQLPGFLVPKLAREVPGMLHKDF